MAVQKSQSARMAVRKAKPTDGDWVACFDRSGKLIGICPPDAITPVSDSGDDGTAAKPKQPGGAAVAQPQAAVAKRARMAAPASPEERHRRTIELRKGLGGAGLAADHDQLARDMNAAAVRVLKRIHSGRRTG